MSEQRNMILAVVLSVAILFGFQLLFPEDPAPPQQQGGQSEQQQAQDGVTTPTPGAGGVTVPGGPEGQSTAGGRVGRDEALAAAEQRLRIATPKLHGSLLLKGARLDDLTLADYHQTTNPASPEIELLSPRNAPNPYFVEFGWSPEPGSGVKVPDANTVWRTDGEVLSPDSPVTLTWDNGEGLTFIRRIEVDQNYMFTVEQRVQNDTDQPVTLYPYGLISRHGTPETLGFYILHEGLLGVFNESLNEVDYDDLTDARQIQKRTTGGWLGITDKYWLTALVPDQRSAFEGTFRHQAVGGVDKYQADYLGGGVTVPAGGATTVTDRLFAGAKVVDVIDEYEEAYNITLFDRSIDWGWFYFLTKPLFVAVDYLNKLLGNMGLAIIALTFVIKFLFLPLAYKSYVSMNAMKDLQPEMMKIRERFGEDRQRMQQEMMALYKKNKVNPVSGCLPILLQIPVFFALYKVLFVTIEMRHAPFYGWIQDLSAPDPTNLFTLFGLIPWTPPELIHLGIWPIIMGVSMWLQQKMNPQPPDPMQAKIMMMLPIVFTFFLARFPAGLVLYWTANNVLSIVQQWLIKRRMKAKAKPATT